MRMSSPLPIVCTSGTVLHGQMPVLFLRASPDLRVQLVRRVASAPQDQPESLGLAALPDQRVLTLRLLGRLGLRARRVLTLRLLGRLGLRALPVRPLA